MKKKILIIEDDKILQQALVEALELADYKVLIASDGEEGLKKAMLGKCDLILLDIILPILDGFQVLSSIRSSRKFSVKNIPIIMLTNLGQEEDSMKAMEKGANDYLIKADILMTDIVGRIKLLI